MAATIVALTDGKPYFWQHETTTAIQVSHPVFDLHLMNCFPNALLVEVIEWGAAGKLEEDAVYVYMVVAQQSFWICYDGSFFFFFYTVVHLILRVAK